jgi:RNA polymerase sigma factor (sigma-70 family)
MNSTRTDAHTNPAERRLEQGARLRDSESDLQELASRGQRNDFFERVMPLLSPLREYIERRFRIAYLSQLLAETAYTSGDLLDEVVFEAYRNFPKKPKDLSLEQWLYRMANEKLDRYFKRMFARNRRRRSLESLAEKEESTLEERLSTDAEGEVMLEEDLPDSEYQLQPEFSPPAYESDPLKTIERREEMQAIMSALARFSQRERMIFELFAVEGFKPDDIAKIANASPEEVKRTLEQVRQSLRNAVQAWRGKTA